MRWADMVTDRKKETRSPEEIKDTIKGKLRRMKNGFV